MSNIFKTDNILVETEVAVYYVLEVDKIYNRLYLGL